MTGAKTDFEDKQRLPDLCGECFMLITQLRITPDFGDPTVLRRRIKDMLDRWERNARKARIEIEDIQKARFALVVFIDETIANSKWSQKDTWMALPLCLELFQSLTGGEEFFIRLHGLRERPKANLDVLEVYYLCMALGFKGKYFLEQEKLKLLIEDTYNEMRRAMEGREVEALSPNGLRRDEAAPAVGKDIPLWVIGAGAATIAVIIFIILSIVMNNSAGDTINLLKQIV